MIGRKSPRRTLQGFRLQGCGDPRVHSALSLLASARELEHSGSTLWDHLIGTFEILRAWGANTDVCLAGLLHSIYSTQFFAHSLFSVSQRNKIAAKIGVRAEHTAYAFCVIDRRCLRKILPLKSAVSTPLRNCKTGQLIRVSQTTLRALRLIDMANELEQQQRRPRPPVAWIADVCAGFRSIDFLPSHCTYESLNVTRSAERQLILHYKRAIATDDVQSKRLLSKCVDTVPRCAEPRLLLAAIQLEAGDRVSCYLNARLGLDDLLGWGVAWDTRVPLLAWKLLGLQVLEAARRGSEKRLALASQILVQLRDSTAL